MNLTCPECQSQFRVPSDKIGETGRKVRCGQCQHIWHVNPPKFSDVLEDTDIDARLDSFKEQEKESERAMAVAAAAKYKQADGKSQKIKKDETEKKRAPFIMSFLIGIIVAMVLLLATLPIRGKVVGLVPSMAHFYALTGFEMPVAGESLVLERIKFENSQPAKLKISGALINLSDKVDRIPSLVISFYDAEETVISSQVISAQDFGRTSLDGETSEAFDMTLDIDQSVLDKTKRISLSFKKSI